MFCLYQFSVKCIIKKNYLPPYGPLKSADSRETDSRVVKNTSNVNVNNYDERNGNAFDLFY